jgi:hypothetical protein
LDWFVHRWYSVSFVDSCGIVCPVGQPTMRLMASNKTLPVAPAATRMSQSEPA